MIKHPQHRLDFGGLDLTGETDYDGVTFEALGEGATLGNPEPVEKSITSALLDGSFVTTESHGNREPSFQVWIRAADSQALANGEKLLFEQCSKRVELGWTPPDGWGPRTVFEAFTSSLTHEFDDLLEVTQLVRAYRLRLVCYPFGFSEAEVVDVATEPAPITPVTVVLSDGTSAAGWTSPGGTVTSSGGALSVPTAGFTSAVTPPLGVGSTTYYYKDSATLTLSAVDFSSTKFLSVDVGFRSGAAFGNVKDAVKAFVDGVALSYVTAKYDSVTQRWRYTWRCDDASASSLQLTVNYYASTSNAAGSLGFTVDNVSRSNVSPSSSTGRQSLRTLDVTGSARTPGSVEIGHATQALNDVLLYTSSELGANYSPPLREWESSANPQTADASTISGQYLTSSTTRFDVALTSLPKGPYLVMARLRRAGVGGDITVQAVGWRLSAGAATGSGTYLAPVTIKGSDPFAIYNLGVITLPIADAPAQSFGAARVEINGSASYNLDEAWLFYLGDDADLTWVKCGSGAPAIGVSHNRLFLDSPNIANDGAPALYVGTQADRSDAFHPGYPSVLSWGRHLLTPPSINMFVVTTGATYPTVTLRHRPAWFTHAGA